MAHLNRKIGIPSFDLTGKTAIITGGTQGLGFGMACALAAYGCNVVITARTASKVEDAAADLNENYCKGGRALGIPADSSKLESIKEVIAKTVEEFGELNILINNAGISGKTALIVETREGRPEYTPEDFEKVIATNLTGTFMFCQEAARQMIKQNATNGKKGGRIIITASVGGFIGGKGVVGYGASKAGCLSLARTMANNFGRENITVNCICPGYVVTPLNRLLQAAVQVHLRAASGHHRGDRRPRAGHVLRFLQLHDRFLHPGRRRSVHPRRISSDHR